MIKRISSFFSKVIQNRLAVLALLLTVSALAGLAINNWPTKDRQATEETDNVLRYSEDTPSEEAIPDNYRVPKGEPLSIEIDRIGTKGFIQKVGVDQHQAVTAPNNVNLAGWFNESVLPGNKGLSIIDGHVSGRSSEGIFKNLPKVKPGDEVIITMGGGGKFTYQVFDTKTIPNEQAASVLFEQSPKVTAQLNLITCTGQYDKNAKTYNDRVIVYAKLL